MTGVIAGTLVITGGLTQALWPFLRKDDWPYVLPAQTPGTTVENYAKNLTEGRWLNYLWWLAMGQHTTPLWASVAYVAAYSLFVAGLWRLLWLADRRTHWATQAVLGVALFVSVVWVRLLYWPGTLLPSALVAAAGVWTLPLAARSRRRLAVWVLVVTVLSALTYPPVGAVLFVVAVVALGPVPWRAVALLSLLYVASYALGVGLIYLLNWFAFGHFGVVIADWRHPNPLHDLHALRLNASRGVHALINLLRGAPLATAAGLVAIVAGALDPLVRPVVARLCAALAVVVAIDLALTVFTGVVTSARGELWLWPALVLPAALLLRSRGAWMRVGVGCLVVLAFTGITAWRADVSAHQQTRKEYDAIINRATTVPPDGTRPEVVIYQDPRWRASVPGSTMAGTLRMMVRQADGVVPRWCRPAECARIAAQAAAGPVVRLGDVVGVMVPPPPPWL